jgi:F-type H+-transporting ATPase subunit delta
MEKADKQAKEIARSYAQAILAVARCEGVLDKVEEELTQFRGVFDKNPALLEFLKDPKITSEGKEKAVEEILGGETSQVSRHHIRLAIDQSRGGLLPEIIKAFFDLASESRGKTTARVITAVPLSEDLEKKLEKTLSGLVGEAVFLKKSVDPSILGGIVIQMGERIIDGSLRRQLSGLREEISSKILAKKGK